jgi:hypothetical protein
VRLFSTVFCVAGLAICCLPATASTTVVNDHWDPLDATDEMNFYEIYNVIYAAAGANFSSTNGATNADGVSGGMDDLCSTLEVFDSALAMPPDATAEFQARYAGFAQRFGYYVNADGTLPTGDPTTGVSNGEFVHLFDVVNPGNTVIPGPTASISGADLAGGIGFYDNAPLGGARTWFSEAGLNIDGLDHMIVYHGITTDMMGNVVILDNEYIIGFEDRRDAGDMDYNDLVVRITFPERTIIPEPATAGLLVLGLAGLAFRRRFIA